MLDKLFKIAGTTLLYGSTSTFLAMILLWVCLSFSWNIDKSKRIKMIAIAQGHDIEAIQREIEDRIGAMTYEEILERRAKWLLEKELQEDGSSDGNLSQILTKDMEDINRKLALIDKREKEFQKYIDDYLARTKNAGISEEREIIEMADPDVAKNILLGIIRDFGDWERVLTMIQDMNPRKKREILYAMEGEEEQKKLVELLQKIGNGEPLAPEIKKAAEKANNTKNTETNEQ
ncbi:MAG: hypothetical protein LBJ00_05430 [Planctomycetaceae bacterium]|jgi:hypothetical protein|nr:hypothetical protein [Planctomycetaceae bacterium]